jgi:hypothetical protein
MINVWIFGDSFSETHRYQFYLQNLVGIENSNSNEYSILIMASPTELRIYGAIFGALGLFYYYIGYKNNSESKIVIDTLEKLKMSEVLPADKSNQLQKKKTKFPLQL